MTLVLTKYGSIDDTSYSQRKPILMSGIYPLFIASLVLTPLGIGLLLYKKEVLEWTVVAHHRPWTHLTPGNSDMLK